MYPTRPVNWSQSLLSSLCIPNPMTNTVTHQCQDIHSKIWHPKLFINHYPTDFCNCFCLFVFSFCVFLFIFCSTYLLLIRCLTIRLTFTLAPLEQQNLTSESYNEKSRVRVKHVLSWKVEIILKYVFKIISCLIMQSLRM